MRIITLSCLVLLSGTIQTCNQSTMGPSILREEAVELKDAAEATDSQNNTYLVATDQVSANNQDAYIEKRDARGNLLWSVHHSATALDERAVKVVVDPYDIPWVVFTIDGGSTDENFMTNKYVMGEETFGNALFRGYGQADGAAQIVVISCLNPNDGRLERTTFFMSRTSEGDIDAVAKTNTLLVEDFSVDNTVNIQVHSWYLPPGIDASHSNYVFHPNATEETKTGDYWVVNYQLTRGLDQILSAELIP